jgi:hypothetical protein
MSVTARLFDSRAQARSAYDALLAAKMPSRFTAIVESPDENEVGTVALIDASMKAGQLLGEHAAFYTSNMQPGQSLVVVDTPLGMTVKAIDIMEAHGALDVAHESPYMMESYVPLSDKAAPLSNLMGWDVLSRTTETYSSFWGFPELAHRLSFLGRWFPPLASSDFRMFPGFFGGGMLSRNPSPLSSMFGLPLLKGTSGGYQASVPMPLLTKGEPVMSTFGFPLLSRRRWFY